MGKDAEDECADEGMLLCCCCRRKKDRDPDGSRACAAFVYAVKQGNVDGAMALVTPRMVGRTQLKELLKTWVGLHSEVCYHVAWHANVKTTTRLEAVATLMIAGVLECRISQVIILNQDGGAEIRRVRIRRPRMIAQGTSAAWLPIVLSVAPDLAVLERLEQILDEAARVNGLGIASPMVASP